MFWICLNAFLIFVNYWSNKNVLCVSVCKLGWMADQVGADWFGAMNVIYQPTLAIIGFMLKKILAEQFSKAIIKYEVNFKHQVFPFALS